MRRFLRGLFSAGVSVTLLLFVTLRDNSSRSTGAEALPERMIVRKGTLVTTSTALAPATEEENKVLWLGRNGPSRGQGEKLIR